MSFLLDTNIISELSKSNPEQSVLEWLNFYQDQQSFLSVISIGEIENGIRQKPESKKRRMLVDWFNNEILVSYASFILNIEKETMLIWGNMTAELKQQGKPMSIMDSLIAATAKQYDLILVTRNTSDFIHANIKLVNPWVDSPDEGYE